MLNIQNLINTFEEPVILLEDERILTENRTAGKYFKLLESNSSEGLLVNDCFELYDLPDHYTSWKTVLKMAEYQQIQLTLKYKSLPMQAKEPLKASLALVSSEKKRNFFLLRFQLHEERQEKSSDDQKQAKRCLPAVCDHMSELVFSLSEDFDLLYLNASARKFLGLKPAGSPTEVSEKVLRKIFRLECLHQTQQLGSWKGACVLERSGGRKHKFSQQLLLVEDKEQPYYLCLLNDITLMSQMNEDVHFNRRDFYTLVYRISHDLRGPIASLLGLQQLAVQDNTSQALQQYFDYSGQMIHKMDHTLRSLKQLLALYEREPKIEALDFHDFLPTICQQLAQKYQVDPSRIRTSIEVSHFFYSEMELIEILINILVDNALRYRTDNQKVLVEIRIKGDGNSLLIKIKDYGEGIPADLMPKIGQMFFKAHETKSGDGLGLYLVRNITQQLLGEFNLYSEFSKSTTAVVKLPYL